MVLAHKCSTQIHKKYPESYFIISSNKQSPNKKGPAFNLKSNSKYLTGDP
jgi:hypothetical protein